jgi:thioredoxin 1
MKIVNVDDNNFDLEVYQSKLPVLLEFGADWCAPCKRQLPLLEKFASTNADKVKVCKIDIDDAPVITAKLKVKSVPTLILFNGGEQVGSKVGLTTLAEIDNFVLTKIGS